MAQMFDQTRAALHITTIERDSLKLAVDKARSGSLASAETLKEVEEKWRAHFKAELEANMEGPTSEVARLRDQLHKRTDRMREIEEEKKQKVSEIEAEKAQRVNDVEKERDSERKRADRARRKMEENKVELGEEIDKLKSKVEVLNRSLAHAEEMVANQVQQPSQSTPAVDAESQSMVKKVMKSVDSIRAILGLPSAGGLPSNGSPLSQHLDFAHQALDSTLATTRARLAQAKADGRAEKTAEAEQAVAEAAKAVVERKNIEEDLAAKVQELAEVKAAVSRLESERKAIQETYNALEASQSASTETLRTELNAERAKTTQLDAVKTKAAETESRLVKSKADSEALDEARAKIKSLEFAREREFDELAAKLDSANSELLTRRRKENELEDETRQLKEEIERVRHDNKSLSEVRVLLLVTAFNFGDEGWIQS
jgi:chromosome segregation ATPase